jgi:hypothetical protein
MGNEIVMCYPTGNTLYIHLFNSIGQIYDTVSTAFDLPISADWADYDISMTERTTATQIYRGDMPVVAAGVYSFTIRKQAGGSPAVSDIAVGAGRIDWNGTAESVLGAIELAAGAIDATAIADGGANKIADHVVRRNSANVEGSSHGDTVVFKSLLGVIAKHTHKVDIDGTDLDTYKSDDATVLGTQGLVTDANAEPVVTVG